MAVEDQISMHTIIKCEVISAVSLFSIKTREFVNIQTMLKYI
jgi:hypothetical protein